MISDMKKIVVIGPPGAGKTTFARRLGDLLYIKVIHLDRYFWGSNWKEKSWEERIIIQRYLFDRDTWIIEGTYLDSSDERLHAADTIIFLDVPRLFCLLHVLMRRIEFHKQSRPDLPEGCTEKLRFLYILKVLVFPHRGRKMFLKKIVESDGSGFQTENKTQFYWLKSDEDLKDFFEGRVVPHAVQLAPMENRQKHALFPKVTETATFLLGKLWQSLGEVGMYLSFAPLPPIVRWDISNNIGSDTMR